MRTVRSLFVFVLVRCDYDHEQEQEHKRIFDRVVAAVEEKCRLQEIGHREVTKSFVPLPVFVSDVTRDSR